VVDLRESGLSLGQIATALRIARGTVQRDLDAVPHRTPRFVLGLDGKLQPTRHNGHAAS
jgi:hypothetical protein